jgi:hypothetical protein
MIRGTAVAFGVLIEILAILIANFVSLPEAIIWVGVVLALTTGLVGGFVAGTFAIGGWQTRAVHGLLTGLIGGLLFGVTLWFSMSLAIPRADHSAFWGINYALATHPIGDTSFHGYILAILLCCLSFSCRWSSSLRRDTLQA